MGDFSRKIETFKEFFIEHEGYRDVLANAGIPYVRLHGHRFQSIIYMIML